MWVENNHKLITCTKCGHVNEISEEQIKLILAESQAEFDNQLQAARDAGRKDGEKIIARGRQYGTVYFDLEKASEVKYKKGDDIPEGKKVGDVKTEAKDPWKDNDFVEYDKLDENTIIGWVKANLGDDEVKSLEDEIARQIDAQENPTTGKGKPW